MRLARDRLLLLGALPCPWVRPSQGSRSSASTFSRTESGLWFLLSFRDSKALGDPSPGRRCRRPALHLPGPRLHQTASAPAARETRTRLPPAGTGKRASTNLKERVYGRGAGPQWEEETKVPPRPARPSDTPRPAETRLPGSRTGFACALDTCSEFRGGSGPSLPPPARGVAGCERVLLERKNEGNRNATSAPQSPRSE